MFKFVYFLFFTSIFVLFSCNKQNELASEKSSESEISVQKEPELSEDEKAVLRKKTAIKTFVESLDEEERVAQLFLVNVEGSDSYYAVETRSDGKPLLPGGTLLFSFNIADTASGVANYIGSIKNYALQRQLVPPFVAVDQEGGDVNRLRGITSVLWSEQKVSERFSVDRARELYAAQAQQLKLLGVDLNLAPVVEVANSSNTEFLGTRTFGTLENVIAYAGAEISALEENGVASCLKHFPGNSATDPHTGLPHIVFNPSDLNLYISPFEKLLPKSSAVLMSHAIMKPTEDERIEDFSMPACFSYHWVTEVVRNGCKFDGLIVSDDIFMGALANNGFPPEVAAVTAIRAGVDVIMLSEKKFGTVVKQILAECHSDKDFEKRVLESVCRVIDFKIKTGILTVEEHDDSLSIVSAPVKAFDSEAFSSARSTGIGIYDWSGK